MYIVEIH